MFTQPYNFFPFCGVSFFLSRVISTKIPWGNPKYYFFSLSSYPHLFHSCTISIQLTQPSVLIFKWFTEDQAKLPLWPFFPPLIRRLQTYMQWEKKKKEIFFPPSSMDKTSTWQCLWVHSLLPGTKNKFQSDFCLFFKTPIRSEHVTSPLKTNDPFPFWCHEKEGEKQQ